MQTIVKMKPSEKQITEIAEQLECGFNCYFNTKDGQLKSIINADKIEFDYDYFEEDELNKLNEIKKHWDSYIQFEGMNSHESFNLMVDFADSIDDLNIKEKLIRSLNKPKPFQNFKWEIDNSGIYRQQWFNYKQLRYIEYVRKQIDMNFND